MITAKSREAPLAFPLDQPIDALPQSVVELTPEQKRALVEIEKRLEQRQNKNGHRSSTPSRTTPWQCFVPCARAEMRASRSRLSAF